MMRSLSLLALSVALFAAVASAPAARPPDAVPTAAGLTPRTAWLLAFHEAQDAGDVARMLLTAQRLERLGEHDLARHVRHVAREFAREAARSAPPAP